MSVKLSAGARFGGELCKVFGLDPNTTVGFVITVDPHSIVTVVVSTLVTDDQAGAITQAVSRYVLAEAEDNP